MRLNNLPVAKGGRKPHRRVGHGRGSGRGKTSGRGQKGQRSRSGSSMRPGFESGHVPLYRRLPRRGFNNSRFRSDHAVVNVGSLDRIKRVKKIDSEVLKKAGLVRRNADKIKILGHGEVGRALKVTADKFSDTAVQKIKDAGGEAIVTGACLHKSDTQNESEQNRSEDQASE